MANPKRRHSNTRSRLRRAHDHLQITLASQCPNCGALKKGHRICSKCGHYRGKQVLTIKTKEKSKSKEN